MASRRDNMLMTLARLGFSDVEARSLLRISRTLHTWAEHECNGTIQRDENTNVPYWHSTYDGKRMGRTSDRETAALQRAASMAATHGFKIYHQADPRGCALYLYRDTDLEAFGKRMNDRVFNIDSCYNSIGTAVCA